MSKLSTLILVAATTGTFALEPLSLSQPQAYPLFSGGMPFLQPFRDAATGWTLEVAQTWWNAFRYDFYEHSENFTYVDAEGLLWHLDARVQVAPGWVLGGRVEAQCLFAGVLDTPIEAFHALFGLPNQGREYVPQNQFYLLHRQGFTPVVNRDRGFATLSLLYLSIQHHFWESEGLQVGGTLGLKPGLPWGVLGSQSWGFHAGLSLRHLVPDWNLWWGAQVGSGAVTVPYLPPGEGWNLLLQAGLHLGWQPTEYLVLTAQLDFQNSPYAGRPSVASGRAGNSLFAVALRMLPDLWLALGLQEEGLTWASVEVGFLAYVVYRPARAGVE